MQAFQELALITPDLTSADLAFHAVRASISLLCQRRDGATLASLAALTDTTTAVLVSHHLSLVISQGLWGSEGRSDALLAIINCMVSFLEEVLSEGSAEGSAAHACRLDAALQEPGVMPCTQLEVVYAATAAKWWGGGSGPDRQTVALCNLFLTTLVTLEGGVKGRGELTGRQLLPIETVEFFLQALGAPLSEPGQEKKHAKKHQGAASSGGHVLSRFHSVSQVKIPLLLTSVAAEQCVEWHPVSCNEWCIDRPDNVEWIASV
jgi:hypothetical protein